MALPEKCTSSMVNSLARLVEIDERDDLEVFVKNNLYVESKIHWHGKQPDALSS